eukprot:m51a1_g6130 hypothetical protein (627) ;mRNA; f:221658-224177
MQWTNKTTATSWGPRADSHSPPASHRGGSNSEHSGPAAAAGAAPPLRKPAVLTLGFNTLGDQSLGAQLYVATGATATGITAPRVSPKARQGHASPPPPPTMPHTGSLPSIVAQPLLDPIKARQAMRKGATGATGMASPLGGQLQYSNTAAFVQKMKKLNQMYEDTFSPLITGQQVYPTQPPKSLVAPKPVARLDLSKRNLLFLPVFDREVKELVAQYNTVSAIMGLEEHQKLRVLDLYHNQVREITGLESLPRLKALMLGSNFIRFISGLDSLTSLEVLDLHSNAITAVENLGQLRSLRYLNLSGNHISYILKNDLDRLSSLTELNLRKNHIYYLDGFEELVSLRKLYLQNNDIKTFKALTSISDLQLAEISLEGNPVSMSRLYRSFICNLLPSLLQLDSRKVTENERKQLLLMATSGVGVEPAFLLDPNRTHDMNALLARDVGEETSAEVVMSNVPLVAALRAPRPVPVLLSVRRLCLKSCGLRLLRDVGRLSQMAPATEELVVEQCPVVASSMFRSYAITAFRGIRSINGAYVDDAERMAAFVFWADHLGQVGADQPSPESLLIARACVEELSERAWAACVNGRALRAAWPEVLRELVEETLAELSDPTALVRTAGMQVEGARL